MRENRQEAIARVHVGNDGGSEQGSSSGDGENRPSSGYILKVQMTGFADGLDVYDMRSRKE